MKPTSHELARFAALTAARLGLRVDLERAGELIEQRAAIHRESIAAYLDRLEGHDPAEVRAVAGELTVGETYFLRHIEQFRAFVDIAVPDRLARGRLRVLSAGCSSGEEPYTLAMLLRDARPDARFAIHAIDVNAAAIARARAGRYSRWSLRATPLDLERRWFLPEGGNVVVAPEIRAAVTFEHGNVLDGGELAAAGSWDVVFCRNMIMYFTDEHADAMITRLAHCIAPGGYLFLGHAETLRGRNDDFALCHTHGAFYYQRRGPGLVGARDLEYARNPEATEPSLEPGWPDDIRAAMERVHAMVDTALDQIPEPTPGPPASQAPPVRPDLEQIRELLGHERFDDALERLERLRVIGTPDPDVAMLRALVLTHAGRFAEARAACGELLAIDSTRAAANYLLALCCESTGDADGAVQRAQLAAELDPSFAMPRVHLGLLARRGGHREIASRELTRAIALLEREAPARLALYGGGFGRQTLLDLCRAELAAIGGVP